MNYILVTGEYPPQPGGVSDYTRNLALGLAGAGHDVQVWTPTWDREPVDDPGVLVHRLAGRFRLRDLARLGRALGRSPASTRIFIQYVPHAFGWKAMNLPFCLLLLLLQRRPLWIMFHEVAYPFGRSQPLKHNLLAAVNHVMAAVAASSAERLFVSIPAWESLLHRIGPWLGPAEWLPVTSNLPTMATEAEVRVIRQGISPSREPVVIGHFGTYGPGIVSLLGRVAPLILKEDGRRFLLLIGRGSERFAAAFRRDHPRQAERVLVTGDLSADGVVSHLAACDCLLQPYPDGVSSRRTSLMAGLALGLPIVTTEGDLTEPIWGSHRAVAMAPACSPAVLAAEVEKLLDDPALRAGLGRRARRLYDDFFSMRHTLDRLRGATAEGPPAGPTPPGPT